jgi:plastocyanin
MKRACAVFALLALCLVALPGHAATTTDVQIVAFNYVPSGHIVVDPLGVSGGAGDIALPMDATAPAVARGDSIRFNNRDAVPHTVTKLSGPGGGWTLHINGQDTETLAITNSTTAFPNGLYTYRCTIHGGMRGAFKVA